MLSVFQISLFKYQSLFILPNIRNYIKNNTDVIHNIHTMHNYVHMHFFLLPLYHCCLIFGQNHDTLPNLGYTHTHTHIYIYIYIYTHTHAHAHAHTHTHTYIYIYIHTHIYTHTHTYIYCIYIYIYIYVCVWVYTCIYSALRKYSYPFIFFMFYVSALC